MTRIAPLLFLILSACSTLRGPEEKSLETSEKQPKSNTYPAQEDAQFSAKDEQLRHLESTVVQLNSRVKELEGQLEATRSHSKNTKARQAIDERSDSALSKPLHHPMSPQDPEQGLVNDGAMKAFRQGMALFNQEKFPESVLAFSAFLDSYPKHVLSSHAQYWIGESYYRQKDFAVADQEFQKLLIQFPRSPRASFALARLSQTSLALGKNQDSQDYRNQLQGIFPKSPAHLLLQEQVPTLKDQAQSETPIATAPALRVEGPTAPSIETPTIEKPTLEKAEPIQPLRAPEDLDGPPGGGG